MGILADDRPDLALQWDYEKNREITSKTPETITTGSNLKVWWKCPICGLSYLKKIGNRTAPSKAKVESDKCPICLGRIIIPGYNSLKARYPEIIEYEWDYEKNTIDPDTIAPHKRIKVWWKCPNGHSYDAFPGNKIQNTGGNCPYCSSNRFCTELSLGYKNPELAKQWHPTKNNGVSPFDIFANHNGYAWWLCPKCGHEWKAKVSNRNVGKRGCPHCANSRSSSIPEQLMFRAISQYYPDAINRYRINKDELDVYIPSIKTGFEYDGQRYHNEKKLPKDVAKTRRIIERGITLFRFRENGCPTIDIIGCNIVNVKYSSEYEDLELKLGSILKNLLHHDVQICFNSYINDVRASLDTLTYEDSFAASESKKRNDGVKAIALWDYEANYPLSPEMVAPFSEKIVSWICPNDPKHKWKNTVKAISLGFGCRKCSTRKFYASTNDWIEEAIKVHGDKFDYSKVNYINSDTKVDIICRIHGVFSQAPCEHLMGKGCPFCAHQQFHPLESLANVSPQIASEWDYELNESSGYNPSNIGIDTRKMFYWHCNNGKSHSYRATIASRVYRNSGCAVCHGKQISLDTSLGFLYPELIKEWCAENDKTPYEVSPGSEYIALWKCCNPNHEPYRCMVYNRTKLHVGCAYCHLQKKHPKDFEDELHTRFPNIVIIKPFQKSSERIECKCSICGYKWNPYPYTLLKSSGCPKCNKK